MTFKPLPAKASLGELRERMPTILIDQREKKPLQFKNFQTLTGNLYTGDYSINGVKGFAVERKVSTGDLASSVSSGREQFEHEMMRLNGLQFKRLLIVGTVEDIIQKRYRANIEPKAVLNTLCSWEVKYNVPVVWVEDAERAALQIESWAYYYARFITQQANGLMK